MTLSSAFVELNEQYLAVQTPAVVAHLAGDAPLRRDGAVQLLAGLVQHRGAGVLGGRLLRGAWRLCLRCRQPGLRAEGSGQPLGSHWEE